MYFTELSFAEPGGSDFLKEIFAACEDWKNGSTMKAHTYAYVGEVKARWTAEGVTIYFDSVLDRMPARLSGMRPSTIVVKYETMHGLDKVVDGIYRMPHCGRAVVRSRIMGEALNYGRMVCVEASAFSLRGAARILNALTDFDDRGEHVLIRAG